MSEEKKIKSAIGQQTSPRLTSGMAFGVSPDIQKIMQNSNDNNYYLNSNKNRNSNINSNLG